MRVITATNRNLAEEVSLERFRSKLDPGLICA
ncbi:MAG TPA: hypothetical protein VIF10_11240 [Methylobacter sp.]